MTAVLIACVLSSFPIAVILGRRFAGKPVFPPIRISERTAYRALWTVGIAAAVFVAFATRGQVVTWDGLVEAQP